MQIDETEQDKNTDELNKIKEIFMSNHKLFDDMGFSAETIRKGYAEISSPYNTKFTDENNVMHRGVVVTLADTACGLALFSKLGKFAPIATVDLRVDYERMPNQGESLLARVSFDHIRKSAAHIHGEVVSIKEGIQSNVIARVSGIFAVNTPGESFENSIKDECK